MKTHITIILLLFCLNGVAQKFNKLNINNSNITLSDCNSSYYLVNVCSEPDSYLPSMMDSEMCLLDSNFKVVKTFLNVFGYDNGSFIDESQYFIIKNDNLYKYNLKNKSHEKLGKFTYLIKKDSLYYLVDDTKTNLHHISVFSNGKISKVGSFKLNIRSTMGEGNQTKVYFNGDYYIYSFAGRIYVYRLKK